MLKGIRAIESARTVAEKDSVVEEAVMAKKSPKTRILLVLFLVVSVVAGAVFLSGGLSADDKKIPADAQAAKAADAWVVRCDDVKDGDKIVGKYCEMAQSISVVQPEADPKTAQRLIEMVIGYPPADGGKAVGLSILPLGILVSEKVKVEIDGRKELDFNVRYCEAAGCIATFPLSEKDLDTLGKGSAMKLHMVTAAGQPVVIEMSLAGFAAAHDKIKPVKK